MRRRHDMPFGATLEDGGEVRFRLWAPRARWLELCLDRDGTETILPMASEGDGWFSLRTRDAGAGSRYRFRIDRRLRVPDPASRFQPADVHGPSEVIDPGAWRWRDADWQGRPWEQAVIYELHVGTFTAGGTFSAARARLDYLAELGVTAIELMPVADFPGRRNWGYDGVLPFAPDSCYGRPDDLKALIEAAHAKGLMVFLDVVYNHFGPEGNYLHHYAPEFFVAGRNTLWGAAINFDGAGSRAVRDFFIHNALYWLEEFHFDGLRLDAVHAIFDRSQPHFLEELAERVANGPGARRQVHLVLENGQHSVPYPARPRQALSYAAQWHDGPHHALHVLLTGEKSGYYIDYAKTPACDLGCCLTGAQPGMPATTFVLFLQNHDQVGNRARGERITALACEAAVKAATAVLLLAPSPPLLFMGEEWAAAQPFPFFCDFAPPLAAAVFAGRRQEFARFAEFADCDIPDPNAIETFARAVLDWDALARPPHAQWLRFHRELLRLRAREILPRLPGMPLDSAQFALLSERVLQAEWRLGDGEGLTLLANLSPGPAAGPDRPPFGRLLYSCNVSAQELTHDPMPAWSVAWFLSSNFNHAN